MRPALRVAVWCFAAMMLIGLAATIALALTAGITILLRVEHPPAGATTLIVALGILPKLEDFLFLMAAVFALTVPAFVVNRAIGIPYPLWQTGAPTAP